MSIAIIMPETWDSKIIPEFSYVESYLFSDLYNFDITTKFAAFFIQEILWADNLKTIQRLEIFYLL